jgi:hypothetical protein
MSSNGNASAIKSEWASKLWLWRNNVTQFAADVFGMVPDSWQRQVFDAFPHHPRIAMKASKGPGKTCCEAILNWNFLVTRRQPNMAAISISGDNLRDNFWKEMIFWGMKSPMIQEMFEMQSERIFLKEEGGKETWFLSARNWSKSATDEELGQSLAGLHSDNVMVTIDESGGMPVPILQAAEGILTSCKEGHIVQAGNTNTLEGALYHACVKRASQWYVVVINGDPDNPNRSPRINLQWAKDLIATEGRDSPFVKVILLGEWPSASLNALIGEDEVREAMGRCYREYQYNTAPRIMGVDVARYGDDASVLTKRQGIVVFPQLKWRNFNSIQGAAAVANEWNNFDADACFIDMTGGWGTGWFDQLQLLKYAPIGVQYAGEAAQKLRYYNKRTEMYFDAVRWIRNGGQLPPSPEIVAGLTGTLYTHKKDQLLLEPKEVVKAKIGYSPDETDSFVQTFAYPVSRREREVVAAVNRRHRSEYNPMDQMMREDFGARSLR